VALQRLAMHRPEELIASLGLASPEAFAHLLENRLVLICSRTSCQPDGPAAIVEVAPARCEVCAGSDLKAAFSRLARVCEEASVRRVLVVGGSPAYRKQLRALASNFKGTLELESVPGSSRRPRHKVAADLRRAQLVVLWGGSILDHSLSEAYRGGTAEVINVSHRGLTGMLGSLRAAVAASGTGR